MLDTAGRQLAEVRLTAGEVNRHVMITGMTGYGKTTTAKHLLTAAREEFGTPFLVIEPAKSEYRQLRSHPGLRGALRVYNIGGTGPALPLRLNPFAPVDGAPLGRHIDLLKSVFNAAFPMFAGMPAVLEEAMLDLYADRGWDLRTGRNRALGPRPSRSAAAALTPTLQDLHDQVEVVLARKGYAGEVHQNMGAALRSRIKSLMVGAKGDALGASRSVPPAELFGAPSVIELKDLADDEEKSFVMGLLLALLYEYAESRQPDPELAGGQLQHITLIEEAHRLLRAPRPGGGMESGDAQAKAVTMFTDMLAEMRAYGEAFVVADQIPTKLAPEVLKNTNVKIIHRLAAPDDRAAVAASINLTDAQSRNLVTLRPGVAVVHDDAIESAVLAAMDSTALTAGTALWAGAALSAGTPLSAGIPAPAGARSRPAPLSRMARPARLASRTAHTCSGTGRARAARDRATSRRQPRRAEWRTRQTLHSLPSSRPCWPATHRSRGRASMPGVTAGRAQTAPVISMTAPISLTSPVPATRWRATRLMASRTARPARQATAGSAR